MVKGLYTAAASMLPRIKVQEAAANNIANVTTSGYKKENIFMRELVNASQFFAYRSGNIQQANTAVLKVNFQQGPLEPTGNEFDIAISGSGYFSVQTPNGTFYTRNSHWSCTPDGTLINSQGHPLLGNKGNIMIDGSVIDISEYGDIYVDGSFVDRLIVRDFPQGDNLIKAGSSLFVPRQGVNPQDPPITTKILQGYNENSNTNVVEEMVHMIETLRNFEMLQRSIQMQDHTLGLLANEIGLVR